MTIRNVGSQNGSLPVRFQGTYYAKISPQQREVLSFLTSDFLTITQIANRRKTTIRNIQKIVQKLKQKGLLRGNSYKGFVSNGSFLGVVPPQTPKNTPPFSSGEHGKYYRFHSLQFDVNLLKSSPQFERATKRIGITYVLNNTIVLYRNKICVFEEEGHSFTGEQMTDCFRKALSVYNQLFLILENDYEIDILKDRKTNIHLVKGHLAEIGSGFERRLDTEDNLIKLKREDGKIFFMFDRSKGIAESETIHPIHFKHDAELIYEKYLRDWVEKEPPTSSELSSHIGSCLNLIDNVTQNQVVFDKNMSSHLEVLNKLGNAVEELSNNFKRFTLPELAEKIKTKDDLIRFKNHFNALEPEQQLQLGEILLKRRIL